MHNIQERDICLFKIKDIKTPYIIDCTIEVFAKSGK